MLNKVVYNPQDMAEKGFPTFGRVDGHAVMLEGYYSESNTFIVRRVGLAALTHGADHFVVEAQDLLDF